MSMLFPTIDHCILSDFSKESLFNRVYTKISSLLYIKSRIDINVHRELESWILEDLHYTFGILLPEQNIVEIFSDHYWLAITPLVDLLLNNTPVNVSSEEYAKCNLRDVTDFLFTYKYLHEYHDPELYIEFYMNIVRNALIDVYKNKENLFGR